MKCKYKHMEIELTKGLVTIVDSIDYYFLEHYRWYAQGNGREGYYYAVRDTRSYNGKITFMHNIIAQRAYKDISDRSEVVDHINRDSLYNCRKNLRYVTYSMNKYNSRIYKNNKSGYTGLYLKNNKFYTYIRINNKNIHIGAFIYLDDAIKARKEAEIFYFGENR